MAGFLAGVLFLTSFSGCFSHEYTIQGSELRRLAALPSAERGREVKVVQGLGERRSSMVEAAAHTDETGPVSGGQVDLHLDWHGGGGGGSARGAVSTARPVGAPRSTGGGGPSFSGGGGGGGDDLAVLAIVVVAVAVMAAAGLAMTEGLRYDGVVALRPEQPVYLRDQAGTTRVVPLGNLSPVDALAARSAMVMDDEGPGFRFLYRRPLDRKGMAFKVDLGSLDTLCACYSAAGVASNIQLGYFPHHKVGILGTLSLGGGSDALAHTFQRHSANVELQSFPFSWWRLHLGVDAHLGNQVAKDAAGTRTGMALGGGGLVELALTTRLALTGRVDYTAARTGVEAGTWTETTTFTGGLAIY